MFFNEIEEILYAKRSKEKIDSFLSFYERFLKSSPIFDMKREIKELDKPSYFGVLNIVHPKDLPKRSNLNTKDGIGKFIHAILHIEYSAIDLAIDGAYRFRDLPNEYYFDWLEVAKEECEHFLRLEEILNRVGFEYGDFPVHAGLFEASKKTQNLTSRMAVIPRYMEANGLDANIALSSKARSSDSVYRDDLLYALEIILEDEIDHVRKGDRWFKFSCLKEGRENLDYFDIVKSIYPNSFKQTREINVEARIRAGFSKDEIDIMTRLSN